MLAAPPHLESPAGIVGVSAFFLAYHGRNDRELQEKTARLFLAAIPSLAFVAPHCADRSAHRAGTRRAGAKIRIGFISRFFASHSIFSTSIGLIEKLSRERFEVVALRITPSRDDEATARIRAAADRTVELDPDVYRARAQIAALELDILFYQDIGMEPISYFLAFARLAPVQCVSFGHPNTTGIPTMDYFISNDLFEPPEPQDALQRTVGPAARPADARLLLQTQAAARLPSAEPRSGCRRRPICTFARRRSSSFTRISTRFWAASWTATPRGWWY